MTPKRLIQMILLEVKHGRVKFCANNRSIVGYSTYLDFEIVPSRLHGTNIRTYISHLEEWDNDSILTTTTDNQFVSKSVLLSWILDC